MGTVTVRRSLQEGEETLEVPLPPGWEATHLRAEPPAPPPAAAGLPAPRSIPLPPGRVLVVVNDAQRATPTPWLLGRLDADWSDPRLRFAVATGSHAPPGEEELRTIFGDLLDAVRARVHLHRAAADEHVPLGRTARGTPVEIARAVDDADALLCLGSVEPHYFAGWTGGRKSLVPGLCSLATMRANHRLALEPGAALCALDGNPLHLDLEEGVRLVAARLRARGRPEPLALNAVVSHGRVLAARHGPLAGAVAALVPAAAAVFGREAGAPSPLVISFVDYPLDRDLYQALKGFEHAKRAVAPGGSLLLVAGCRAGIGPPTFTQLTERGLTRGRLAGRIGADYRLGDHKLLNILDFLGSGRRLLLVSPALAGREDLAIPVFPALAAALAAAAAAAPPGERRALVIEDAASLAPRVAPLPGGAQFP